MKTPFIILGEFAKSKTSASINLGESAERLNSVFPDAITLDESTERLRDSFVAGMNIELLEFGEFSGIYHIKTGVGQGIGRAEKLCLQSEPKMIDVVEEQSLVYRRSS